MLAGAGERHICPFASGVLGDDQMHRVGRLSLSGERVLNVGEPRIGSCHLILPELKADAVGKLELELARPQVNTRHVRVGPVAELPVLGETDGAPDLDVIAGMQVVGSAGKLEAVLAELAMLVADRLGASVQLVEVLV